MSSDEGCTNPTGWQRTNPRTGLRQIADRDGVVLADCVGYEGGPTLEEAQTNAELIVSGIDPGALRRRRGPPVEGSARTSGSSAEAHAG
jgi:hypothetical protein